MKTMPGVTFVPAKQELASFVLRAWVEIPHRPCRAPAAGTPGKNLDWAVRTGRQGTRARFFISGLQGKSITSLLFRPAV